MSMFICARCDGFRDSDDGCEEAPASKYPRFSLLCVDCATEEEEQREAEAEERAREFATDQAIGRIKERKMGLDR